MRRRDICFSWRTTGHCDYTNRCTRVHELSKTAAQPPAAISPQFTTRLSCDDRTLCSMLHIDIFELKRTQHANASHPWFFTELDRNATYREHRPSGTFAQGYSKTAQRRPTKNVKLLAAKAVINLQPAKAVPRPNPDGNNDDTPGADCHQQPHSDTHR